jgi:hypothetical protein
LNHYTQERRPERPARGPFLTFLLALITLGSLFSIGSYVLFFSALQRVAEREPDPTAHLAHAKKVLTLLIVASIVRLVCSAGMWMWKQWGVFGYVAMGFLQLVLSSKLSPTHHVEYSHVVWIVLVLAAALPKWSQFER